MEMEVYFNFVMGVEFFKFFILVICQFWSFIGVEKRLYVIFLYMFYEKVWNLQIIEQILSFIFFFFMIFFKIQLIEYIGMLWFQIDSESVFFFVVILVDVLSCVIEYF